ncbi:hypothetical protein [Alteromonas sp. KUL49]|uniref:hypothetical protein n=1 Tax=Alteromonas sp. KUL49 TaxID=2480798 RepID=UPI00102EE592|nr:hypothetical protein [Alteromonas sp. KUL49]TAP38601.1 hypothetical protein EYS00_14410 [Alteromonas sp. KUL49]GEA12537.1 hypothetical protein KUL49_29120 [Alteromonas sp. KUL49]
MNKAYYFLAATLTASLVLAVRFVIQLEVEAPRTSLNNNSTHSEEKNEAEFATSLYLTQSASKVPVSLNSSTSTHVIHPAQRAQSVEQWLDILAGELTEDTIANFPSAASHTLAEAAANSDSVYYQVLRLFTEAKAGEKKYFLQAILMQGNSLQRIVAIDSLLYSEQQSDINAAIDLTFSLENHQLLADYVNDIFTLDLRAMHYERLFKHLSKTEHKNLAQHFSDDIFRVYQMSDNNTLQYQALKVLLKNTDARSINIQQLLLEAPAANIASLLKLIRRLFFSDKRKLGDISLLASTINRIAQNQNLSGDEQALAEELISILKLP